MKNTTIIGLTGSIGMGKSTTSAMFSDLEIPVWDADQAVHKLYDVGGAAVSEIANLNSDAVSGGKVDRTELKKWILDDKTVLEKIEKIVHPLVEKSRNAFLAALTSDIAVLDIPLLFENGLDRLVDVIVVATIDPATQRNRVLARKTMTREQFKAILSKQIPDQIKQQKADYIIETDTIDHAKQQVLDIVQSIRKNKNA